MIDRRTLLGSTIALTAGLAGSTVFAAGEATADLKAAAAKEKPLVIYSDFADSVWRPVVKAFGEAYPGLQVQPLNIAQKEMSDRYFAEKQSGAPFASIIVSNYDAINRYYISANELLDYTPSSAGYLSGWGTPAPGVYAMSLDPVVMVWNKLATKGSPEPTSVKTLVDIVKADPARYKGKLTSYAPDKDLLSFGIYMSLADTIGKDAMWSAYEVLGPATKFESSTGSMVQKLLTGEYLYGYYIGSAPLWASLRDPAYQQVLGWSFMSDGTPAAPRYAAISKVAPAPATAKLFMDFLLSRRGAACHRRGRPDGDEPRTSSRPSSRRASSRWPGSPIRSGRIT